MAREPCCACGRGVKLFSLRSIKSFTPHPHTANGGISSRSDCSLDRTSFLLFFVQLQELWKLGVGQSIKLLCDTQILSSVITKGLSRVAHHSECVSFLVFAEIARFLPEREMVIWNLRTG